MTNKKAANSGANWGTVEEALDSGIPQILRVSSDPILEYVVDAEARGLALRTPAPDDIQSLPELQHLSLQQSPSADGSRLEVRTGDRALYPLAFRFFETVVGRMRGRAEDISTALTRSLESWRELLADAVVMSPEQQLGLFGELWLLHRLLGAQGDAALESWTGPLQEPHDFRLPGVEIEVKAAGGRNREHFIHGAGQLVASEGCELYLLSLHFEPAGSGGTSLRERIGEVRGLIRGKKSRVHFDQILQNKPFYLASDAEAKLTRRYQMRTKAMLIPVDDNLPRITRADLDSLDRDGMERVSNLQYSIDVSGLGAADGTLEFTAIVPGGSDE